MGRPHTEHRVKGGAELPTGGSVAVVQETVGQSEICDFGCQQLRYRKSKTNAPNLPIPHDVIAVKVTKLLPVPPYVHHFLLHGCRPYVTHWWLTECSQGCDFSLKDEFLKSLLEVRGSARPNEAKGQRLRHAAIIVPSLAFKHSVNCRGS